ncbi:MAG: peptidyl-prolyl cis-trans isomerase [bacterium]|nr:peptidyl-prolyl cis-trans isomerase [bacterium]
MFSLLYSRRSPIGLALAFAFLSLAFAFLSLVACSSSPVAEQGGGSSANSDGGTAPAPAPATTEAEPGQIVAVTEDGEILNRVRLVVGSISITQIDIDNQIRTLRSSNKPPRNLQKAAVDRLITRAIVSIEAERESIIVSEARMENEIRRRQLATGIDDFEEFKKVVTRQTGSSFDIWVDDLKFEIIKRQLVQVKLTVPQPSESEVETFYRKNRRKVGIEIRYREMMFAPKNGSIAEESRVSKLARQAYDRVRSNPSSFPSVARSMSENVSPLRAFGGLQDYLPIQDIAERDQILAGILFNHSAGQVPRPFRTSGNRYVVVLIEGKRPIPLNKVREQIRQRLYFDKENETFEKWLAKRRKQIAISTFN